MSRQRSTQKSVLKSEEEEEEEKAAKFRITITKGKQEQAFAGFNIEQQLEVTVKDTKTVNFHDIVDEDQRAREEVGRSVYVRKMVESVWFRGAVLSVILLNSLVLILQTDRQLEEGYNAVFLGLDKFFLTVFVMDILFKWYVDFTGFWIVAWNVFDFVILAASLVGLNLTFLGGGSGVIGVFRVLRALRSLRCISALRGLQLVVHCVVHSLPDMANIISLLFIVMFLFAIIGHSTFGDQCPRYFSTLGKTLFSLFICVTQDGWIDIATDLEACGYFAVGAIYLVLFITIGAFIFANLVVAVMVTNMEWIIEEKRKIDEQHHASTLPPSPPPTIPTITASHLLPHYMKRQIPVQVPRPHLTMETLEHFFLLLSSTEDNLEELGRLLETLDEITIEIRALAALAAQISEEGTLPRESLIRDSSHVTTHMIRPPSAITQISPSTGPPHLWLGLHSGDALSQLLLLSYYHPHEAKKSGNIHSLLKTLVVPGQSHTHLQSATSVRHGPMDMHSNPDLAQSGHAFQHSTLAPATNTDITAYLSHPHPTRRTRHARRTHSTHSHDKSHAHITRHAHQSSHTEQTGHAHLVAPDYHASPTLRRVHSLILPDNLTHQSHDNTHWLKHSLNLLGSHLPVPSHTHHSDNTPDHAHHHSTQSDTRSM